MPAFCAVVSVLVSLVRTFSTNSRPASGRPPAALGRRSKARCYSLEMILSVRCQGLASPSAAHQSCTQDARLSDLASQSYQAFEECLY
jgi:hypothetical protein